jgi:hypothetical protein
MTATNHALTGVAIALAVKQPVLAIPLAFASHFVLDAVPHYNPKGINGELNSGVKKWRIASFRRLLAGDLLLFGLLLMILPIALKSEAKWWVVLVCAFAGFTPDLTWGWHFYRQKIGRKITKPGWLSRFHIWVQWMERPWGLGVEFAWFATMLFLIYQLGN